MFPQLYTLQIIHEDYGRRWIEPIDIVSDSIDKLRDYARKYVPMPYDDEILGTLPDTSGMVWYIEYHDIEYSDMDWRARHTMLCLRVVTLSYC